MREQRVEHRRRREILDRLNSYGDAPTEDDRRKERELELGWRLEVEKGKWPVWSWA